MFRKIRSIFYLKRKFGGTELVAPGYQANDTQMRP